MTFSALATRILPTAKYSDRQSKTPTRLIVHHCASTSNGNAEYLASHTDQTSATYCLLTTAVLVGIVPEEQRPWTTGSYAVGSTRVSYDNDAITVEVVNSTGAPEWAVTDAQVEMLAQLAADLSTRYSWGPLTRANVIGHREVNASHRTVCPGPYLLPRLDAIVARANAILGAPSTAVSEPQNGSPMTTYIDGKPVRDDVAAAFRPMAAAFKAATGCSLHVTDGIRTMANQQKAYDAYRAGKGPVAAKPTPSAPHIRGVALDLHDSGRDAGVTRFNNARNSWLDANCGRFGFSHTGKNFNEAWHYEYVGGGPAAVPAPLSGTQRRTVAVTNGRADASSKSARSGDPLKANTVGNFTGWKHGESVSGNNVWFRGTSGRWFWSGGFTGGANTAGLANLNPAPAPAPTGVQRRKVGRFSANGRAGASRAGGVVQSLPAGTVGDFNAFTYGENVEGNNVWFRGAYAGRWFWSGGFEGGANTAGLAQI